jgi:hypothetical protein
MAGITAYRCEIDDISPEQADGVTIWLRDNYPNARLRPMLVVNDLMDTVREKLQADADAAAEALRRANQTLADKIAVAMATMTPEALSVLPVEFTAAVAAVATPGKLVDAGGAQAPAEQIKG